MNTEVTTWIGITTAIIILIIPAGLALFHGGLSDRKKIMNIIGVSYATFCVATFALAVVCYIATNGIDGHSLYRSLDALFSQNISPIQLVLSIPELTFIILPGVFAAIISVMICGSLIIHSMMNRNLS